MTAWSRRAGQLRCIAAHEAAPELGIVGCWSLHQEDIVESWAVKKVRPVGDQAIMENCWVGGAGHVMKRKCVEDVGPLEPGQSFPQFCLRVAERGWTNGFAYPFVMIDHLDDPRVRSAAGVELTPEQRRQRDAAAVRQYALALEVQTASPDVRRYIGWRALAANGRITPSEAPPARRQVRDELDPPDVRPIVRDDVAGVDDQIRRRQCGCSRNCVCGVSMTTQSAAATSSGAPLDALVLGIVELDDGHPRIAVADVAAAGDELAQDLQDGDSRVSCTSGL